MSQRRRRTCWQMSSSRRINTRGWRFEPCKAERSSHRMPIPRCIRLPLLRLAAVNRLRRYGRVPLASQSAGDLVPRDSLAKVLPQRAQHVEQPAQGWVTLTCTTQPPARHRTAAGVLDRLVAAGRHRPAALLAAPGNISHGPRLFAEEPPLVEPQFIDAACPCGGHECPADIAELLAERVPLLRTGATKAVLSQADSPFPAPGTGPRGRSGSTRTREQATSSKDTAHRPGPGPARHGMLQRLGERNQNRHRIASLDRIVDSPMLAAHLHVVVTEPRATHLGPHGQPRKVDQPLARARRVQQHHGVPHFGNQREIAGADAPLEALLRFHGEMSRLAVERELEEPIAGRPAATQLVRQLAGGPNRRGRTMHRPRRAWWKPCSSTDAQPATFASTPLPVRKPGENSFIRPAQSTSEPIAMFVWVPMSICQ